MTLVADIESLLEAPKSFQKKCAPRLGECYSQAANALMFKKGWVLVHGRPTLQLPPFVEYGHAWLEKGSQVFDPSTNTKMPRMIYYALGQIDYRSNLVYTFDEARDFMLLTEHFGPWEGIEGTPPTSKQKKEWKESNKSLPKRSTKVSAPPSLMKEVQKIKL